mgnify:CR=1 FL=1
MSSCSFINNSLLHGSAWCSVAHPRSPGPEPAYLRVPRSRLAAASMFLGGTPKMLKSLNSIGRGYLRLLLKPGRPSIKYDRSIERSHGTGCDQSQRVFNNGSAHFLYGDRGMTRRLGFCSTHISWKTSGNTLALSRRYYGQRVRFRIFFYPLD